MVLSSVHPFLAIRLALTPNAGLINVVSSLLRCLRTIRAKQDHAHRPQVYKSTRSGTLCGRGFGLLLLFYPNWPSLCRAINTRLLVHFIFLTSTSKTRTYKVKILGACSQHPSPSRLWPRGQTTLLFVPSSPGSPTPPVPSSLPTTLPSPCQLILSAEVLLRSLCRKHPSGRGWSA